ncbi:MAG: serine O-acetyltransferase EpsC [Bacteroidota bacterium]
MQNKNAYSLEKTIERLSDPKLHKMIYMPGHGKPMPSASVLKEIIEKIRAVLFPGFYGESKINTQSVEYHIGYNIDWIYEHLTEQIRRGICFACPNKPYEDCEKCKDKAPGITARFIETLPDLRKKLGKDVAATYNGDPASKSQAEIIFCYPGIKAITNYRIAHELWKLGIPLLPRIITEMAHSETGIDLHPKAEIGESFVIDHGTGVVIGATCIIGNGVKIYQGVTLGAKSFPADEEGNPIKGIERHPIVKNNVVIYAETTILGRVTIGANSVIGGNVWLTRSIPENSTIIQQKAQTMNFANGEGI